MTHSQSLEKLFSAEDGQNFQVGRGVFHNFMISSVQESLGPIFDYFLAELKKQDGQMLDIRLTVEGNKVKLEYGVSPIIEQ